MGATDIKNQYLKEVTEYDEDKYREEIRNKADEYGVQYKENYAENSMGATAARRKKMLIIAGISIVVITGIFIYLKKSKKWIFAKK